MTQQRRIRRKPVVPLAALLCVVVSCLVYRFFGCAILGVGVA